MLGWFLLIAALALVMNLVVIRELMQSHVMSDIEAELDHETLKFRKFAQHPVDDRGQPFATTQELLTHYLGRVIPNDDEMLFSVVDGVPGHRTRGSVPFRLDTRADVIANVIVATRPATHVLRTNQGDAVYAVIPVVAGQESPSPGTALVIVEYAQGPSDKVRSIVPQLALSSLAALLLAGGISWFVAGRVLAPLQHVRSTAEAIGESDLTRRIDVPPDARDDVARLARTFNSMLDRLEAAFVAQRSFLDDVAHELRTPLTVVRGHLELMGDDPHERASTTDLLLDEVDRMNRMVDDLLLLAASERPDFLTAAAVDLADLVLGVIARASALADRRFEISQVSHAEVLADRQRLTQALLELVSNAVSVTGPGDRIRIGSHVAAGTVLLTVSDTGPGVPAADRKRIFDRFQQSHGSTTEGTGLGLAIVASIAAAHQGSVDVVDTPGGGTTFRIRFPARFGPSAGGPQAPLARHPVSHGEHP